MQQRRAILASLIELPAPQNQPIENAPAAEPARFLQHTLDRFIREHAKLDERRFRNLQVTLSTDPHEWRGVRVMSRTVFDVLSAEAYSCGFVNKLAPWLCEKRRSASVASRPQVTPECGVGSCFPRLLSFRDAEGTLSSPSKKA